MLYFLLVVEGQPQGFESRYGCVVQMRGSATPGRPQGKSVKTLYISKIKRRVIEEKWAGT